MADPKPKARRKSTASKRAKAAASRAAREPVRSRTIAWAELRFEYENTDISIRQLAAKFNVHHTSVLRRKSEEGWRRNVAQVAAHIAERGFVDDVLDGAAIPIGNAARTPQTPRKPLHPDMAPRYQTEAVEAEPVPRDERLKHIEPLPSQEVDKELRDAALIALVQRQHIRQEDAMAIQVMTLSARVLDLLDVIVTSDDPAAVSAAADRLSAISDKNESFSAILRAATSSFKEAAIMRRKAIGLDTLRLNRGESPSNAPIGGSELPKAVVKLLPDLDINSVHALRDVAEKLEKLQRR